MQIAYLLMSEFTLVRGHLPVHTVIKHLLRKALWTLTSEDIPVKDHSSVRSAEKDLQHLEAQENMKDLNIKHIIS
jgi:hypothetical protein